MKSCAALKRAAVIAMVLLASASAMAADTFRTDGGDEKLPWFQLKPGEFPPEGSAHYISGELIAFDHVNRTGVLRHDRNDSQRVDEFDQPLPFAMLPYGVIYYRGAPAELRDVPIGTHLHGEFYLGEDQSKDKEKTKTHLGKPKLSIEAAFSRALRLEDDFSHSVRKQRAWRIEQLDTAKGTLSATGMTTSGQADAKPTLFEIGPYTRVWKNRAMGSLSDIAPGQLALVNLTICTLRGPGRCVEIWLDEESRSAATAQQLEVHRQYIREHGAACWVDAVDNKERIVSVTLFWGIDTQLTDKFQQDRSAAAAVAMESLRTYDQHNDVKRGPIVKRDTAQAGLGSSGIRIHVRPGELLEGYRPKRILRLFAEEWKLIELPREERLWPQH